MNMKRMIVWILVLTLLMSGCGSKQTYIDDNVANTAPDAMVEETASDAGDVQETVEETQEETTVPTEPEVLRNPLNGEVLDAPFTGRIFANTVSNLQENLPHVGVNHADVVMEMYVNMSNVVRCLALFSDIEKVDAIGSTRSTRPIFNDIAQHYDLILTHAGGSDTALRDASNRGIVNYNIDSWVVAKEGTSYRDTVYKRAYENTLFGVGAGIKAYAEAQGVPMELEKDYGFRFTENGTPAEGEAADRIALTMVYGQAKKDTQMVYNAEMGKYIWNQYGKEMRDQITDELEGFTNVIIMQAMISHNGIYHSADFVAGGTGYYANGGKLIPIVWACDDEDSAFRFMTNNAEPLEMGVGNTYIAIVTPESPVSWEALEPEQPAPVEETVAYDEAAAAEETVSATTAE